MYTVIFFHVCSDIYYVYGDIFHVCGDIFHVCGGIFQVIAVGVLGICMSRKRYWEVRCMVSILLACLLFCQ